MADIAIKQGIDLSAVFGPVYWGFLVSLVLTGVAITQAVHYFFPVRMSRDPDPLYVQYVAATMLVLDLVSPCLNAQSIHHYLLKNFGFVEAMGSITPAMGAEWALSVVIAFIAQMYFVHQLRIVYHLGKIPVIVILIIVAFSVCGVAFGIATVVSEWKFAHGLLTFKIEVFNIFLGLTKGFSAAADILATIAMCITLKTSYPKYEGFETSSGHMSPIRRTQLIIRRLFQLVIQRGVLVSIVQTGTLVAGVAFSKSFVWFPFHANVTQLYANTFFSMLNARQSFQGTADNTLVSTSRPNVINLDNRRRFKEDKTSGTKMSDIKVIRPDPAEG